MVDTILFDLDGTLTDSGLGITSAAMYGLEKMGWQVPDRKEMYKFIGPPLFDTYQEEYGMTPEQAQKVLKNQGLTAKLSGNSGVVTGQIPSPGQSVPGGSEVLIYLGENPEQRLVAVPDFSGMHAQAAADAAGHPRPARPRMGRD